MSNHLRLFSLSICASRGFQAKHTSCMVEAHSANEALNLGTRIAEKRYPQSQGWSLSNVVATDEVVAVKFIDSGSIAVGL